MILTLGLSFIENGDFLFVWSILVKKTTRNQSNNQSIIKARLFVCQYFSFFIETVNISLKIFSSPGHQTGRLMIYKIGKGTQNIRNLTSLMPGVFNLSLEIYISYSYYNQWLSLKKLRCLPISLIFSWWPWTDALTNWWKSVPEALRIPLIKQFGDYYENNYEKIRNHKNNCS